MRDAVVLLHILEAVLDGHETSDLESSRCSVKPGLAILDQTLNINAEWWNVLVETRQCLRIDRMGHTMQGGS
jgi:hypothetical protein